MSSQEDLLSTLLQAFSFASSNEEQIEHWRNQAKNLSDIEEFSHKLNHHLQLRTYVVGYAISQADIAVYVALTKHAKYQNIMKEIGKTVPHLLRWVSHLESLPQIKSKVTSEKPAVKAKGTDDQKGLAGWKGSYEGLEGASQGNVVTRFPPEPSGFLHIGHIKAAMLNNHYAEIYSGKLILRFDDTNPAKEKDDYVDNIMADLKTMNIQHHTLSYTSDHFDTLEKYAEQMLKQGKAYIDLTPVEQMREERGNMVESKYRSQPVEENLRLWQEMKKGSEEGLKCVMRAKIDMKSKNGAMRDPGMYRCSTESHYRVGTKYKAYPMYDFACPIVDSIEGVTHALRSSEYHDRNPLYYWVVEAVGLRKPVIEDFSRLNFEFVLLSKRKLQYFVDNKLVSGWDDPRFPTVQGVLRRGMTIEALREFILAQGASKALNLMTMDKLWTINKLIIDPIVPRYTALDTKKVPFTFSNGPATPTSKSVPRHKKNSALGNKVTTYTNKVFLEPVDAKLIKENEEVTLMDWGNAIVRKIVKDENGEVIELSGDLHLEGDFKSTEKKLTWLPDVQDLVPLTLRTYGHLITKGKLDEFEDFKQFINPESLIETAAVGDPNLRLLNKGDKIQLERRGYFICDAPFVAPSKPAVLILIPDGKPDPKEEARKKEEAKKREEEQKKKNEEARKKKEEAKKATAEKK